MEFLIEQEKCLLNTPDSRCASCRWCSSSDLGARREFGALPPRRLSAFFPGARRGCGDGARLE